MRSAQGLGGKKHKIPSVANAPASQVYIQIKPCLDCRHSTRTKRVEVFLRTLKHASIRIWTSVEVASSLHVSFVNSVVRLWMKCPRLEARRRRQLGRDIATLPSSAIDTTESLIGAEKEEVCLDQDGAYHMMTVFQQDLDLELQSGEPVCAAVVSEILANAIEAVQEAGPEHCFIAVALPPMDDQIVGPALRVTDI